MDAKLGGQLASKAGNLLRKINKVYNAEAIAMLEGLRRALKSPMTSVASGIHNCLDNLGVIPRSFSQKAFRQFSRRLASNW